MKGAKTLFSSESVEWYTPQAVQDRVRDALGMIDLDPACNAGDPHVSAAKHFRQEDDGLKRAWEGRVFLNPPYGRTIGEWMRKFSDEFTSGNMTAGIALVPVRTDTAWWHATMAALPDALVCYWAGRIKFDTPMPSEPAIPTDAPDEERTKAWALYHKLVRLHANPEPATFPSALIAVGVGPSRCRSAFSGAGHLAWGSLL